MVAFALAMPVNLEDQFAFDAAHHGHEVVLRAVSAPELASRVAGAQVHVALVAAESRYLTDRLIAACDHAGVRLVVVAGSEREQRYAADLGLYDIVEASTGWSGVDAVLAQSQWSAEPSSTVRSALGQVIAVWGPGGAPGRTSVAISIAAELAALGYRVALADVDTHGASVAPALGMLDEAPGFAAACRLAATETLSTDELARIGQRYESPVGGFWVLTGIGRPSRWPELSAERVATTIAQCRQWVDYTVLDTSSSLENDEEISSDLFAPRRNAAAVTAVRAADHVIAVGAADPVGLSRFLRAHVDLLETVTTRNVSVVMNKVRVSASGLNPHGQVTQTLSRFGGIEHPVLVPHDLAGFDGAVLSGKTLVDAAPRSSARTAMRDLVTSRLVPEIHEQPPQRSWFSRMLTRR
ncbi:MinD-like ATPase involved in chromosome partitioning or flagellar assembly [Rhodoglobus vestalii]|uniref:MinD-like ATPase involved in chromosome partitioning or flagellar assembly n=1 Tax=Rhodoglobus vestalii TaxID=193384 RepID=A0A8H2K644_9MICO|nr:P-loop NTPase [Rhodoglobus vestalii]TQO20805.1 MinD-like ATPase involved in chromosome partitioning or flagellar assembly [Rhodoglobus vestalii]